MAAVVDENVPGVVRSQFSSFSFSDVDRESLFFGLKELCWSGASVEATGCCAGEHALDLGMDGIP